MAPSRRQEEARDELRPTRDSLWSLVPRRNLVSAAVLVLILVAVIALRHRAGALARTFGEALLGAPATRPAAPARSAAPRVRLAPP